MTQLTTASGNGTVTAAASSVLHMASGDVRPVEIIALVGEFDISNVRQLEHAIDQGIGAGARDFVADLSEVEFLDAAAVQALLDGWKSAARRNGCFVLVNPPARIWRAWVLIGVSRMFATFPSRHDALAYVARANG